MPWQEVKSIDDVMAFLLEFTDYEKITNYKYDIATFNLGRVQEMLAAVGSPQRDFPAVHIAGTKGKGSTASMVQSILTAAGLRVGCFTSPHLVRLEERMTIDGRMIPERELVALTNELIPFTEKARRERPAESPTYFELVTALGFLHFARAKVDFAVIEVGMGGRLDATNVILPEVSIITRIDFDHVSRLGNTLAKIASEKGGIIKPGVPVVISQQPQETLDTLLGIARERDAPVLQVGRDIMIEAVSTGVSEDAPYCRFSIRGAAGGCDGLELRLIGAHQAVNAASAIAAIEVVSERCGVNLDEAVLRRGLANARCPGRLEYLPGEPPVLIDGAHNPVSIDALRRILDTTFKDRRVVLIVAVARDKDIEGILSRILPRAAHVVFTHSDSQRSEESESLLGQARELGFCNARAVADAELALGQARDAAGPGDLICITGSLYLAGKLRPLLLKSGLSA